MEKQDKYYDKYCFSLDIGTKSIVGIIGHIEDNMTVVDYSHTEFHDKRVMFDGQIHDIDGVASIANRVKNQLQQKSGLTLENVSVAAAGRSLKTVRCSHKLKLSDQINIDKHIIKLAEMNALNKAKEILESENPENSNYYCVGHTIVEFSLDDSFIKTPLGHRGNTLEIEIIATFLPKIVVESLNLVMEKIDLIIDYMTLEPIAAIEVSVPENARLLNIAMVDIGAGTSDIAITKNGTICAYAMTPTAGDEITESISENYLMDFDQAEALKCNLNVSDVQIFEDIVGIKHTVDTQEILRSISQSIETVSKNIATGILRENQKSPSAVFLVGGSSQIPGLAQSLSTELDISVERVVIKKIDSIKNLMISDNNDISGPEYVTPVGILVSALKNKKNDFIEIKINGKNLSLFRTNNLKISDAVLEAKIDPLDLMPQKGKSITIKVNDIEKRIYGDYGITANIYLNDKPANLDSLIKDADNIVIDPAVKGKDARITLKNLFEKDDYLYVNDEKINRVVNIKINNIKNDNMFTELYDNDAISYDYLYTVEQLADFLGYDLSKLKVYNNGNHCNADDPLFSESHIEFEYSSDYTDESISHSTDYINQERTEKFGEVNLKENILELTQEIKRDDSFNPDISEYNSYVKNEDMIPENNNGIILITCNGKEIRVPQNNETLIMADILDYIDFDRTKINGRLIIEINDEEANFASVLNAGDNIILKWENDLK